MSRDCRSARPRSPDLERYRVLTKWALLSYVAFRETLMIDFRSDTVIEPTKEMRRAMAEAPVGDDFYADDPSTRALEEFAAECLGKQSALFTPTGVIANALGLLGHGLRPDGPRAVLMDEQAHVNLREMSPLSSIAFIEPTFTGAPLGPDAEAVEAWLRSLSSPEEAVIVLENTNTNRCGKVVPLDRMLDVYEVASRFGARVHLDGTRLFNAAVVQNTGLADLAAAADTVVINLCKGLGAPVGAILAGPDTLIAQARELRKTLGGTMRRSGHMAAAGLVALKGGWEHMRDDHRRARDLASGLATEIDSIRLDTESIESNIVMFDPTPLGVDAEAFAASARKAGIIMSWQAPDAARLVVHRDISDDDITAAVSILSDVASGIARGNNSGN